jgi:hypothetical protein
MSGRFFVLWADRQHTSIDAPMASIDADNGMVKG